MITRALHTVTLSLALLAGCGGADHESVAARAPAKAPAKTAARSHGRDAPSRVNALAPAVVHRLTSDIEAVSAAEGQLQPERLAEALRAIAAALEMTPLDDRRAPEVIRQAADRLLTGERTPAVHAALARALTALVPLEAPPERRADFARAMTSLDAAVRAIDHERPLAPQAATVSRGLRAAGDAILTASGSLPWFESAPAPATRSATSFATCAEDVRAAARSLAAARYPDEREAIATALGPLADCIGAAPAASTDRDRLAGDIRFQAARIRSANALERRLPAWIRGALGAAIDALEALPAASRPDVRPWLDAARRTTSAIDDQTGLAFQRARIQDAYRATADALAILAARAM